MATTIELKNSVTTGNSPSSLAQGETGWNITDKKVWIGNASSTPIQLIGAGASMTLNSLTTSTDASISGLTVGKGGGAVSTNTAFGYQALNATNTGGNNTGIGYQAGFANTSGTNNTSTGWGAGALTTTGANNANFGAGALFQNTTGGYNVAVGSNALYSNTTASNNTAVGYQAGYSNTTGTQNTCVGYVAGYNTTGSYNTYLGVGAGYQMTSGSYNTVIGNFNGNQNGLSILTASNYIVLSDGDGNPRCYFDNNGNSTFTNSMAVTGRAGSYVGLWYNTPQSGNTYYHGWFSNGSQTGAIYWNGTATLYTATSDQRLKENIVDSGSGLAKLAGIKIRSFDWIDSKIKVDFGVIAQELAEVAPEAVLQGDDGQTVEKQWSADASQLVPAMIKAIQEQQALITDLTTRLAALEGAK